MKKECQSKKIAWDKNLSHKSIIINNLLVLIKIVLTFIQSLCDDKWRYCLQCKFTLIKILSKTYYYSANTQ